MNMIEVLDKYPVPISVVVTILIMWALSKFIFPHLGKLGSWFSKSKDQQIEELQARLTRLEVNYSEMSDKLNKSEARENQMLGLLRGLGYQLKTVGVDVDAEIEKIIKRN